MRKIILFCMILMLVFTSACSPKKEKRSEDFLYDKSLEMISVMEETALSQAFIDAVLPTEDNPYFSNVSQVDLEKPSIVFEIEFSKELLDNQFPKNITYFMVHESMTAIKSVEDLEAWFQENLNIEAIIIPKLH